MTDNPTIRHLMAVPDDFTADDVHQMKKQGDLSAFIRSQMRRPTETPFPEAVPPKSRADGRPVGAWPEGCSRPGSPHTAP